MTQEFHISVTPVRNDEYLVRTETVAPGVPLAEEQVVWEVDRWLALAHQLMDDPLLGVLRGYGVNRIGGVEPPAASQTVEEATALSLVNLGQALYSSLFQGTLRDSWLTAQGIAQHRGEVLRLRLGLKGSQLPRLPWEVLHGGDVSGERVRSSSPRPLAAGTDVIFSRYQPGVGMAVALLPPEPAPLRILMAIAAPTDQEQLNLKQEALHLQQELRNHGALSDGTIGLPDMQVTILDQPGREQLTQALEQGNYQVFHFAGHSNLGAAGGMLYLVNHRTGLTETLSGDDLAGLLVNNNIRMAVFNSCRGAYTATDGPLAEGSAAEDRNLAAALVNRGIPSVLAMAERIPDDVALTLTRLFYRNLKQGYPVDLSLSRARQGLISAYGSHQLYWALPILYLHPDFDGYLTGGDRTLDNPADSVVRSPRQVAVRPSATIPTATTSIDRDANQTGSVEATGFDDQFETIDDLEYLDDLTDDPEHSEDRFVVANVIEQLTQRNAPHEPIVPAAEEENLLPTVGSDLEIYNRLPEHPHNQQVTIPHPKTAHPKTAQSRISRSRVPQFSLLLRKRLSDRRVLLPLSAAGVLTIALLGVWVVNRQRVATRDVPDLGDLQTLVSPATGEDVSTLQRTDTPELTTIAVTSFSQDKMPAGQQAVEILLDRNALLQAESSLAAVPTDRVDSPAVSFLRGRLTWQSLQVGNSNYSLDDARRAWEFAAQGQPNSIEYHKSLGFAYYAEGKSREAIQAWSRTLALLQAQASGQAVPESADPAIDLPNQLVTGEDALTAYAGIALALLQASKTSAQREELESKAAKLYRMVNEQDPLGFQPAALAKSQNWLWTESAIQNWQKLSTLEP